MNKSIIAAALLALVACAPANAEDGNCVQLAELAGYVMKARQNGIPATRAVDLLGDTYAPLADMAYRQPRYHGEEMQERTVTDFADYVYIECRKAVAYD